MKFNKINVFISDSAKIGKNVRIGDNVSIYDNVVVGDNVTICNDCVLGEPLADYYKDELTYENPTTIIGDNSMLRSHCIIYAGTELGKGFNCGHRVTIREYTTFQENCRVGTVSDYKVFLLLGKIVGYIVTFILDRNQQ